MRKQFSQWCCDNCGKADRLIQISGLFMSPDAHPADVLPPGWLHMDIKEPPPIFQLFVNGRPNVTKQFCSEECKLAYLARMTSENMVGI